MRVRDRATLADAIDLRRLTERELARRASLSHATVNHLLTGRRSRCSLETAEAICEELGCTAEALFLLW